MRTETSETITKKKKLSIIIAQDAHYTGISLFRKSKSKYQNNITSYKSMCLLAMKDDNSNYSQKFWKSLEDTSVNVKLWNLFSLISLIWCRTRSTQYPPKTEAKSFNLKGHFRIEKRWSRRREWNRFNAEMWMFFFFLVMFHDAVIAIFHPERRSFRNSGQHLEVNQEMCSFPKRYLFHRLRHPHSPHGFDQKWHFWMITKKLETIAKRTNKKNEQIHQNIILFSFLLTEWILFMFKRWFIQQIIR